MLLLLLLLYYRTDSGHPPGRAITSVWKPLSTRCKTTACVTIEARCTLHAVSSASFVTAAHLDRPCAGRPAIALHVVRACRPRAKRCKQRRLACAVSHNIIASWAYFTRSAVVDDRSSAARLPTQHFALYAPLHCAVNGCCQIACSKVYLDVLTYDCSRSCVCIHIHHWSPLDQLSAAEGVRDLF